MDRIECEIDRWKGRHNNKVHMKEVKEQQKRNNVNRTHDTTTKTKNEYQRAARVRAHKNNLSESRHSCNKWEYFHEAQQQNTVMPSLGTLLRTLDDGNWRRRLRRFRDHKRGNKKIGEIDHRKNIAPETNRPKSARAAWKVSLQQQDATLQDYYSEFVLRIGGSSQELQVHSSHIACMDLYFLAWSSSGTICEAKQHKRVLFLVPACFAVTYPWGVKEANSFGELSRYAT